VAAGPPETGPAPVRADWRGDRTAAADLIGALAGYAGRVRPRAAPHDRAGAAQEALIVISKNPGARASLAPS